MDGIGHINQYKKTSELVWNINITSCNPTVAGQNFSKQILTRL